MEGPLLALWIGLLSAAGALLAWRATGLPGRPLDPATPGRLFVLFHLLFLGVGSVALVASGESAGAGPSLGAYAFVAFGIGALLARRRWGAPGAMASGADDRPVSLLGVGVLALAGLVAVGSIAVQNGLPFLTADPQTTRLAFGGLIFDLFRWFVPPAALVVLAIALARRERGMWIAAIGALGAVVGLELLMASRVLPLELLVGALLITWWAGRRLPRRAWVGLLGAVVVLFVGVQLARVGPRGGFSGPVDVAGFVVERTSSRIFLIQPRTVDHLVDSIPAEIPFFGGGTYVRRFAELTGSEPPPNLGRFIFQRLFPGQPDQGFITPGVLGEGWANFGPLALLGFLGLGVLGQSMSRWVARLGPGPVDRVFAALLAVALARTYATSLNGFIATLAAIVIWTFVAGRPGILRR